MIKRLNLFKNSSENDLVLAMIDRTHQKIKFGYANKIFKKIGNQNSLKKNFRSSNNTIRIKSLIMLHYLIRKSMFKNQQILTFAGTQLNQMKSKKNSQLNTTKSKIAVQIQQKQYIQKNIIQFYILYLLKFMAHQEAYCQAKCKTQLSRQSFDLLLQQKNITALETTSQTKLQTNAIKRPQDDSPLMLHINNGFEILNLINFILQSQQSFNKMGRYYVEQDEILNLFIMYLDDLTIYNDYTKRLAKLITKRINQLKQDQIKHCFLYLTESQKTSDRLYEFYYNRYYYSRVKKLITLPTFLSIDNDDFQRVVKQIKRVDKGLFLAVKQSKYSEEYKINKTMHYKTETSVDRSSFIDPRSRRLNHTMRTQTNTRNLNNINRTIQDLKTSTKSKQEAEQNIARYIQCLQDIDEQQFI